jgi:hypothetical protein
MGLRGFPVTAYPGPYRLTFLLPSRLLLMVQSGRHQPCLHGCVLLVGRGGLVTVEGPSKEKVFKQVGLFLKMVCKGHGAVSLAARVISPGGCDGWSIIVGAKVAFSPTCLDPHIPAESDDAA